MFEEILAENYNCVEIHRTVHPKGENSVILHENFKNCDLKGGHIIFL